MSVTSPDDRFALVRMLRRHPRRADPRRESALHALLLDPEIDPRRIERAGWALLRNARRLPAADAGPQAVARWLEQDGLARALLGETQLTDLAVERLLTPLRRWLLLAGRNADFPRVRDALVAQAAHNGGVWPFDADEAAALGPGRHPAAPFAAAYRPVTNPVARPGGGRRFDDAVTDAVADQYTDWPYPVWQRAMTPPGDALDGALAAAGAGPLPDDAQILVAGCGTGREAIRMARRAPRAQVTAIDLSATSLAYAEERAGDLPNLRFERRDLHAVAALGRGFDHIACSGVLHHLPDPEAGWAALTHALKPGGAMRVMLYSRIARMQVAAARARIADLRGAPMTADLIRTARARLMADPPHAITGSVDFYSMGGVRDLLFPAHEDPFDIPRIARALDRLGLDLLGFALPTGRDRDAYLAEHPHDPLVRDTAALHAWERRHPRLFGGMYDLWCRRP